MQRQPERAEFPLCYGCGRENPIGFKLQVYRDGNRAYAEFVPGLYHSGWPDIVHGGVLCALLDEVMGYLPYFQGLRSVTGKMEVRLRRPARPGDKLLVSAEVVRQRRTVMEAKGVITLQDGTVVAESDCLIFILGKEG